MKSLKKWWLIAIALIIIVVLTTIICISFGNKEEVSYPPVLDDLYHQTETAIDSYISLFNIMDDVIEYEKAYAENPNWENLKNLKIATNYALTAMNKVPLDVLTLTDSQLEEARQLGFDVSTFINFCGTILEAQLSSNITAVSNRAATAENFTVDSNFESLKNDVIIDEKTIAWYKDYLLLELQYLWADFPEPDVKNKLAKKFPDLIDKNHIWESDKDVVLKKSDEHFSVLEEIIAEQNRILGNNEAMLEIDKEEKIKAKIIEDLPTMVLDPFLMFPTDTQKTTIYKTDKNAEIDASDVSQAVALAKKCTITYENISYGEYASYLAVIDSHGYKINESKSQSTENSQTVTYTIEGNDYQVKYNNQTVMLEISDINTMVLVPLWYMQAVSPELFKDADNEPASLATNTQEQVHADTSTPANEFEMPEKDKKQIQLSWNNALDYFSKQIAVAEKILNYEKAYIDKPTIKNLLNLQFMTHLGMKELESSKLSDHVFINDDIKNKMPSKESYERAVKNRTTIDSAIQLATLDRKASFDNHFWYNTYYKDTQNFIDQEYKNLVAILKECKNQLSYTVYLVSQNLGENQGKDFINTLNQKYPNLLSNVQFTAAEQSEDSKMQTLNNISYLYDKLSDSNQSISNLTEKQIEQEKRLNTVLQNLGTDKECFTSPEGTMSQNTIPWVFSFTDAKCSYVLSDNAKNKTYAELTPEDIKSYSIVYPDKTYEDALEGISRLESKGLSATEDSTNKSDLQVRWNIDKNGKNIIYEWNKDKVTMYFPDTEIAIVPYGWYHYFR